MRALIGAIIAAGAMIGLGLLNIGIGHRYAGYDYYRKFAAEGNPGAGSVPVVQYFRLADLDTVFLVSLVTLLICLAIGLGIAFVGLAYHHHRRGVELHHLHRHATGVSGHGPTDRPPDRVTV